MAIAPVLKTGVRKGMGVRIPRSPSSSFTLLKLLLGFAIRQIRRCNARIIKGFFKQAGDA